MITDIEELKNKLKFILATKEKESLELSIKTDRESYIYNRATIDTIKNILEVFFDEDIL